MAAFNLTETIYGVDRKPRSIQQWQEISHSNTQKVTQMGCQSPVAWVLIHGKNIPPNAIVAGEDRRKPLYIARTFWEGGVRIGEAASHFEKGASFAYNGKEIHVDTYEVLVPLQQTVKYHIAGNYSIPSIPRISQAAPMRPQLTTDGSSDYQTAQLVQKLRAVKVVMVIDDSISMAGSLWRQARLALTGLVSTIETDSNANGIDLCFLNNPTFESNIKSHDRIERLFNSVRPEGSTPTGSKLQELFNMYLPLVEDPMRGTPPTVIMVITDGVPTDTVDKVIVGAARRLDNNNVPLRRFGVSFVQIGDDPDAAEYLKELDDDIGAKYTCRDMVDTTPYNPAVPELTREAFIKRVLGSIDPYYNQTGAQLVQKLRAVKVVMVVDDSISMAGSLWHQAGLALTGLVSTIETDFNANGIDLCFLNNPTFESNIKSHDRVESIFKSVRPEGSTPTGAKLQELFNMYLPLVEDPMRGTPPTVIMVITDGVPTDTVDKVIVEAARRLDDNNVPLRRFGVSFVQIGDDPDAAEYLKELDDDIGAKYTCRPS
ncbi:hypothetical protein AGABI1DRAFT_88991 [Agaricus bisporus var. burnettii JB137-S8]|uniref:VWFA domain-containing protein n=1 Tax=Agaricus bisporus var. burnettii (strain JB137-S8 / ATCC MYA-4627 / FGSC 10392) TaxID=597362 RepID=K5X8K8_AGABU|nr:uncharacterized protein AGABI1DRAFT_88991 [Agaricus bisporus var. burnettii JB137-S8]EKM84256.1 hypothetical protein AGABI1DRAFT_88991 [Agaricus bisporus var. burnettii JB137-S8]